MVFGFVPYSDGTMRLRHGVHIVCSTRFVLSHPWRDETAPWMGHPLMLDGKKMETELRGR